MDGVRAAIRHIQAAERHYQRASEEGDEEALNDVIYRTNQAFEGMLKEAFGVLTSTDGSKKSPYEIEKHLLEHNVLAERVLVLLTNYRQEWRNPSTHNHRLFFDEQEALLAIVSVSAFANILLDQIVEAVSYAAEQRALAEMAPPPSPLATTDDKLALGEQVARVLAQFAASPHGAISGGASTGQSEIALIGQLCAYLEAVVPELEIARDPRLAGERLLRPDLVLKRGAESTVIEVKASVADTRSITRGIEQLRAYVVAGDFASGVLFFPPHGGRLDGRVMDVRFEAAGVEHLIHVIASGAEVSGFWHDLQKHGGGERESSQSNV